MKLTQLHALLNAEDGVIESLNIDFRNARCQLELTNEQHSFTLTFDDLKEFDLYDTIDEQGEFFEVTLCKQSGSYYLSLAPYEDNNKPSEFDDLTIIAGKLAVVIDGIAQTLD